MRTLVDAVNPATHTVEDVTATESATGTAAPAGPSEAIEAIAGGLPIPVGEYRYDTASQQWTWSDGMYAIHGFCPGEVVPTSELMAAHRHPDDRDRASDVVLAALADGEPFSCRHRIEDAAGRTRTVIALGEGELADDGTVVALSGYFMDVTDQLRGDVSALTKRAVDTALESRGAIEQAKGAFMLAYCLDPDEAFDLLRWHSQHTNTKLRELADTLVRRLTDPDLAALTPRRRIHTILVELLGHAAPVLPGSTASIPAGRTGSSTVLLPIDMDTPA
ncbi:MAG: PAS and ANTAR domain-containing protein [Nakamurella sp.]